MPFSGKGLAVDYSNMLRIVDQLSARPAQDVQELVNRFVAFILMGNTNAHLKNWALRYPDGINPELAPLYDPVCVTALFEDVPLSYYGVNRAIDQSLRAFTWDDLASLLRQAQLPRVSRVLQVAKAVVAQAKTSWPELLKSAPETVQRAVSERLAGGVALVK